MAFQTNFEFAFPNSLHEDFVIAFALSPSFGNELVAAFARRSAVSAPTIRRMRLQGALKSYTLSPSVDVPRGATFPFVPHFQPLMAGMSSPCRSMYSLC